METHTAMKPRRQYNITTSLLIPWSSPFIFESRFESGNLKSAVRIAETEYNLELESDFNSKHYSQWYFFSVRNTRKGDLNIINLYIYIYM